MAFQSKNRFIQRLIDENISITWGFLLLGFDGPGTLTKQISQQDIIDYCLNLHLQGIEDRIVEDIAFASEDEEELIRNKLNDLSKIENNSDIDLKTWEYLLLEELIPTLPKDPLRGLLELTDFWSQFNYPKNSPHQIQGRNNTLTPQEFYTRENFNFLLEENKKWLQKTENELKRT
jgi:hypothetical protein